MKIDHILKLSRLKVKGKEKKELEKEFSSILNFVKKLKELEVKNVKPMTYPIELKNILREDEIFQEKNTSLQSKKLIELAPKTKERSIKVKQVF
ncbi:MAG: hypothetical protein CO034_01175 [Parcubacteria group bacterium CG_4_9_14_0_2_um_filter_35_11]|nr:MAG: hypothetical protein COS98_01385 [Parcubacteria group bacterium CG07_land_8_20_14_0_80_35_11]PJC47831.1 MAG: hypothetical protein CO034_01175 [Parcubacteria group bacterium CG_4_9_14_0_2_um_filter_35_11]